MTNHHQLERETVDLEISGVHLSIAAMRRPGEGTPIVFLHGFGSTKEDYADLAFHPAFDGRPLIAYDAPGCGETACGDLSAISIPFLREVAERMLAHFRIERFHLVGHSMGGLTALMLADALGDRVISFFDIEGNVAPEDCFLSRQILEYPAETADEFMDAFVQRAWSGDAFSHPLYAASLRHKVRAEAVSPIFTSMVALSDNDDLMGKFLGLPCAKMFVYGERNRHLSYLGHLVREGVQLAEIPMSGHWPMYANAPTLWDRLDAFITQSEQMAQAA